ncbi:MFS transporter [Agreia pratensis]|uniref:MFS transporter n=1 Tax=Agreia pratensis TaxID=150121 RepID=UPI00188BFF54|nr:MFS transporter [Agreia pratensis]MBF4635763.1 MFS transporter [Agreia pratensis]
MTIVQSRSHLLLFALAFCQFLVAIDYNIVLVALPQIGSEFGIDGTGLQWIVSAYALAFGGLLLLSGRLADVVGRRRMMMIGFGLYGLGSIAAAVTPFYGVILAGRVVQGIGGAFLSPAVLATIAVSFPEGPARFKALSIWSAAGAAGLAGGSALGGVLIAAFDWRSVFAINVPLVIVAAALVLRGVPADATTGARHRIDIFGAATSALGITAIVYALGEGPTAGWTSPNVLTTAAIGAVLLVVFIVIEKRSTSPLLPLSLLRNRSLAVGLIVMILFIASIGTSYYTFSLFLQQVLGASALTTGLAFLPWGIMAFLGSSIARLALGRFGLRGAIALSAVIAALGTAGFATSLYAGTALIVPVAWTLLLGVGQAMGFASLYAAAGAGITPERQGVASATMTTAQQVGTALGLSVLAGLAVAVSQSASGDSFAATAEGLRVATWASAAVLLSGAALALVALRKSPATQD